MKLKELRVLEIVVFLPENSMCLQACTSSPLPHSGLLASTIGSIKCMAILTNALTIDIISRILGSSQHKYMLIFILTVRPSPTKKCIISLGSRMSGLINHDYVSEVLSIVLCVSSTPRIKILAVDQYNSVRIYVYALLIISRDISWNIILQS